MPREKEVQRVTCLLIICLGLLSARIPLSAQDGSGGPVPGGPAQAGDRSQQPKPKPRKNIRKAARKRPASKNVVGGAASAGAYDETLESVLPGKGQVPKTRKRIPAKPGPKTAAKTPVPAVSAAPVKAVSDSEPMPKIPFTPFAPANP